MPAVRSIAEIDADLVVAYASRRAAMQASSYGANGKQVSRDLRAIESTISNLKAERAEAENGGERGPLFGQGQVLL
jgi:hypothetical protein